MANRVPNAAGVFTPTSGNQVSPLSYLELQYKVEDLEREQACSRSEVADLKTLCYTLRTEIHALKNGGWNVTVRSTRDQYNSGSTHALDTAIEGADSDTALAQETRNSCCNNTNVKENKPSGATVPPHLRPKNASSNTSPIAPHLGPKTRSGIISVPPHLRNGRANGSVTFQPVVWAGTDKSSTSGKSSTPKASVSSANSPLATDGNIDTNETNIIRQMAAVARESTPPLSPKSLETQMSSAVQHLSIANDTVDVGMPQYIVNLPELSPTIASKIPSAQNTVSFSGDFLRNHLGGIIWGPGMVFVPPPQPSTLPDRVYYTVDPAHDPHLPSAPGKHGAKLVPFFNSNPEDNVDFDLPEGYDSASNVPLFVLRDVSGPDSRTRKRYVYYGHYTQSRWSDRLDSDRMAQCVPAGVREFWADELSASGRPEWVTDALQKHFFPAPAYDGALPAVAEDEGGSVAEEEMAAREAKVARDAQRYVKALRVWKKEADMLTSLIKKDFILTAFDLADADEPNALRLWWEYLECVDWSVDFYNTLVTLQSRNASYA